MHGLSVVNKVATAAVVFFGLSMATAEAEAATVLETGGSDFVAIGVDPSQLHSEDAWKRNDIFRTPACQYDAVHENADATLKTMRNAGQKKVGTMLWFTHLEPKVDCSGFLLNSNGGRPSEKVLDNLRHFIREAGALGFDEVQLRFAPMGTNRPNQWQSWNDSLYSENMSFITATIAGLSGGGGPRVIYDLSAGLGGMTGAGCPVCEQYVQRLWSSYLKRFPRENSYGASVGIAPGRITRLLADLKLGGGMPSEIGIGTYHLDRPGIALAAREMKNAGVWLPIFVQEMPYADPDMYRAIVDQARANGLQIRAMMQWPVRREAGVHITESSTPMYIYNPTN